MVEAMVILIIYRTITIKLDREFTINTKNKRIKISCSLKIQSYLNWCYNQFQSFPKFFIEQTLLNL